MAYLMSAGSLSHSLRPYGYGRRVATSFISCSGSRCRGMTSAHSSHHVLPLSLYSSAPIQKDTNRRLRRGLQLNMASDDDDSMENDTTNKIKGVSSGPSAKPFGTTSSPWENPRSLVGSLLERTTSRAMRTLSTNTNGPSDIDDAEFTNKNDDTDTDTDTDNDAPTPSIENALDATIIRSSSVLEGGSTQPNDNTNTGSSQTETKPDSTESENTPKQQHQDKRTYLGNPSVTPTALAHSLWQATILPYEDTVIDATCGNGKDMLALSKMLFPDDGTNTQSHNPQLIGIDIQSRAVHNTERSLLASLPSDIYYNSVTLLEQSHEHLMDVPRDASNNVGLVCYNLGYLPGGEGTNYKECQTQTTTTLNSITDASLLLRVGGLLSVMTYPGSNLEESIVVEHFVEGLAMLTTRNPSGWRGYAESIPEYDNDGGRVRTVVTQALERIVAEGDKKQTWRSFVHKPLGRPLSPVLVTAMRIK